MSAHHDLRLRTSLPYERVETMLTTCCIKLYSMTLDGFEETKAGPRKVIRISFEDPSDRERFRVSYQKTRGLEKADIPMPPTLANPRTN